MPTSRPRECIVSACSLASSATRGLFDAHAQSRAAAESDDLEKLPADGNRYKVIDGDFS